VVVVVAVVRRSREEAEIEGMDFILQSSIATVDASVTAPPRDPPLFKDRKKAGWSGLGGLERFLQ
jgi:hypothetical protein